MTNDVHTTSASAPEPGPARRSRAALWTADIAIVVGLFVGLAMLLDLQQVSCAVDTDVPGGAPDACFAYPHALAGAAVIAGFVALGALVHLVWVVIAALDRGRDS